MRTEEFENEAQRGLDADGRIRERGTERLGRERKSLRTRYREAWT